MKKSHNLFSNCPFENGEFKVNSIPMVKEGNNLKEYSNVQDKLDQLLQNVTPQGVSFKLAKDIYSRKELTIHQEKQLCKKAYNEVSFVQMSLNNLISVIEGDHPKICSDNSLIEKYGNKWAKISGWASAKKDAEMEALKSGDGYVRKIKGDKGSYKYFNIPNAEDIYIDWDYECMRPKRYIQKLYFSEAQAKKLGIKSYNLVTPFGFETIQGIEYSTNEIIHFKYGDGPFGIYGRSAIASIINDVSVLDRLERSIAIIAMFKAIPQKILMPKAIKSDKPIRWTKQEVDTIGEYLSDQKDYESPILNVPIEALNVTDSGQIIELNGYLDYYKRKITIALSPEFIAHGDIVNRSVGDNQKQVYYLSVIHLRNNFIEPIEESLQEGLTLSLNVIKDKVNIDFDIFWYEWGEFDVETRELKNTRLMNEYNSGLITLNEYREEVGYKRDELLGDLYKQNGMDTQGQ